LIEWFSILIARLQGMFRRESVLQDMEGEMRSHIEMEMQSNIERGMRSEEARADGV
jgi:hypothetical protein